MANLTFIGTGQIEYIEGENIALQISDDYNARRLKVRVDSDGPNKSTNDLPWAFPLMPKTILTAPQIGEGVLVFCSEGGNFSSQRFYLGPIISQEQFQEYDSYEGGRGSAVSLLLHKKPSAPKPLERISNHEDTLGSFPRTSDVALVGRGKEDVIVRYDKKGTGKGTASEVDIRAGVRQEPLSPTDTFKGNVVFNSNDPAYIQVKHSTSGLAGFEGNNADERTANGIVNVVADKINLMSHKDTNLTSSDISDPNELVPVEKMDEIMAKLHPSVYGDDLVKLLKIMCNAIVNHVHPMGNYVPCVVDDVKDIKMNAGKYMDKMLSKHVRLS